MKRDAKKSAENSHRHHWTMAPMFWVTAGIFLLTAALVYLDFHKESGSSHRTAENPVNQIAGNSRTADVVTKDANDYAPNSEGQKSGNAPQDTGEASEDYDTLKAKIASFLSKGPEFYGIAVKPIGDEIPVNFQIGFDTNTDRAAGEIDLLTSQRRVHVEGTIRRNPANSSEALLQLANGSYDDNCTFTFRASDSGQALIGSYQFRGWTMSGKLILHPGEVGIRPLYINTASKTQYEVKRDLIVAALRKGPDFLGKIITATGDERKLTFHIDWDSRTQRATGALDFPDNGTRVGVDGDIEFDKELPGQIVLYLANGSYDQNSHYKLHVDEAGVGLIGTYQFNTRPPGKIVLQTAEAAN